MKLSVAGARGALYHKDLYTLLFFFFSRKTRGATCNYGVGAHYSSERRAAQQRDEEDYGITYYIAREYHLLQLFYNK